MVPVYLEILVQIWFWLSPADTYIHIHTYIHTYICNFLSLKYRIMCDAGDEEERE